MKRCGWRLIILVWLALSLRASGQVQEVQQLLLNVEKLAQLKNSLADLKKGYEIVAAGYTTIRDLSQGNFRLHQAFLDGLLDVSPVVKNYHRVGSIVQTQRRMVQEYKTAWRQALQSRLLTVDELAYLKRVYENLLSKTVANLEALARVITAGSLRMSDGERLTAIDAIEEDLTDCLAFLRHFNNETKVLLLQRRKAAAEISHQKKLYTINP